MIVQDRVRVFVALLALAVVALPVAVAVQAPSPTVQLDPANAFFDDTALQEVRLTINPKDWQTLKDHYLDNGYYTADFRWGGQTARNSAIRSRGTGSRSGVRPGLRVDFDHNVTNQTLLGLKSVILRNNTQDASSMHERISMLFFRRMGLPASREAHAKLYINNVYDGLYLIVESVDKGFLKKTFNENNGDLFKYDYNADDPPYYLEDRGGSDPKLYDPHPFKPETNESAPPPRALGDWIQIINHDSDTVVETTMAPYLDLDQFIKHIAIEMFLADNDGFNGNYGTNNFYLYLMENQKRFNFIAWDKSNTFIDGPTYPIFHNINDQPPERVNRLSARVLTLDTLKNKYLDALLTFATALSDATPVPTPFAPGTLTPGPAPSPTPTPTAGDDPRGWMEREVEREYAQIKDAFYTDPNKTDILTNAAFEKEVDRLREFARERSAFVRSEVFKIRPAQAIRLEPNPHRANVRGS